MVKQGKGIEEYPIGESRIVASSASIKIAKGKKFQLTSHEAKIVAQFGQEMNFPSASDADVRRFLAAHRNAVPIDSPPRPHHERPTFGHFVRHVTQCGSALVVFGSGTTS